MPREVSRTKPPKSLPKTLSQTSHSKFGSQEKSHLPVIADPSHGIGVRKFVENIALASVMGGADGVIMEVHQTPEKAFSDGQQTLSFQQSEKLIGDLEKTYAFRQSL